MKVLFIILYMATLTRLSRRHWRELTISPMYELTILHWEHQLQKNLGKNILHLVRVLSGVAAQVKQASVCFTFTQIVASL